MAPNDHAGPPVHLTRKERGRLRRVTNLLLAVERREFSSTSGGAPYTAMVLADGKVSCNCRGWTIKRVGKPRQCRHTHQLIAGRRIRADDDFQYLILE